jgi:hypothetical protein
MFSVVGPKGEKGDDGARGMDGSPGIKLSKPILITTKVVSSSPIYCELGFPPPIKLTATI